MEAGANETNKNKNDNENTGLGLGSAYKHEGKVFKYKCSFSATITDTMKRRGWVEVAEDADDWDIFWCDMNQLRDLFTPHVRILEDYQKIGHYRNCFEISRKNLMVKNLKRLKGRIEKAFGKDEGAKVDFFPTTFILPTEHKIFMTEYRRSPDSLWIIKPAAGAQGRGIFIFQKLKDYFDWRSRFDCPEHHLLLQQQQNQILEQHIMEKLRLPFDAPKLEPPDLSSIPKETYLSPDDLAALNADNLGLPIPPIESKSLEDQTGEPTQDPDQGTTTPPDPDTVEPSAAAGLGTRAETSKNDIYVVQRYIKNPYLIGGRKFDIRLYVLVHSYQPLKVWIYREGFARFSASQFSLKSLQDIYVHLTNVAIQRTSEDYNPEKGSKWSLRSLREYLTARHGREAVQQLMNQIDNIVIRTLQSVHQLISQDRHCFEVYGFDVLIDSEVRPWLLEVNASPAFTPSNEEDYRLKCALVDDTVHVLDLEGRLTGYEKRIGGYDLIWNDGPVYANASDCGHVSGADNGPKLNSFLGCINDRVNQLREIFANAKFIRDVHRMHAGPPNTSAEIPLHTMPKPTNKIKDDRFRLPGPSASGPDFGAPAFMPVLSHHAPHRIPVTQSHSTNAANAILSSRASRTRSRPLSLRQRPKSSEGQGQGGGGGAASGNLRVAGKSITMKKNVISFLKTLEKNKHF